MHLFFLTTGGTIDKDYPHATGGWAFEFGDEPAVARLLRERLAFPQPSFTSQVIQVCRKDSLEINDEDREAIWKAIVDCCRQQQQQQQQRGQKAAANNNNDRKDDDAKYGFVITHGTDTMLETGKYLQNKIATQEFNDQKSLIIPCIVITGAMRPERFSNSDAPLNVGMAIAAVEMMAAVNGNKKLYTNQHELSEVCSVHVAMHGVVKSVITMQRDKETGRFY